MRYPEKHDLKTNNYTYSVKDSFSKIKCKFHPYNVMNDNGKRLLGMSFAKEVFA